MVCKDRSGGKALALHTANPSATMVPHLKSDLTPEHSRARSLLWEHWVGPNNHREKQTKMRSTKKY